MAKSNVRLAAANLLLNRGVRFTIPDAPFLWRLFRINRIHIRPLKGGTIAEISRLTDIYGLDQVFTSLEANQKLEAISLIIATAMLNRKGYIRFAPRLAGLLLWKVPAHVLTDIYSHIKGINELSAFISITIFFSTQARMMMSPKTRNTGQAVEGS